MATLNILTPEELETRVKKRVTQRSGRKRSPERTRIIDGFKEVLQQAEPGYGGDVLLSEGEDKRVVRQNLKAAADELHKALDFRPIKDRSRIHFRVITPEEKAAKPSRGGRPRKTSGVEQEQMEEAQAPPDGAAEETTRPAVRRTRASSRRRQQPQVPGE